MNISVIICTLDNWQMLDELLNGISKQNVKPFEIIIVHGEKNLETRNISLKWNRNRLNIIYRSAPRSLVIQRNMGIDIAKGEIICFLDDDVVLEQDYFRSILETYKADSTLGGVQGTITNNKKTSFIKRVFYKLFLLDNMHGNGKLKKSGLPSFHRPVSTSVGVKVFNGCLMSFRSDVLTNNKFDLFFEKNWWGDDYENSYNIAKKHTLLQIPNARLFHYGNTSFKKSTKLEYMRGKNLRYIRNKHGLCKGLNRLFCFWSDMGQLVHYFILYFKGEGFNYVIYWIKGLKGKEYSK